MGHAVFAEQPGHVVATVRCNQRVVGLLANVRKAADPRGYAVAEVGGPDLAGIEQAEHKALAGRVDQANHPGALGAIGQWCGRNIGHLLKGLRIENLDAARDVVRHGDQFAVLADGAADAVAALYYPMVDALGQQVDLAQPTVAAEHIGIALVAGEHHRGMGQIAQPLESGQCRARVVFDDLQAAGGALHHHAKIAGATQRRLNTRGQQQPGRR
ncbi:hypothetical protein D3C78_1045010 [compost metagenome]